MNDLYDDLLTLPFDSSEGVRSPSDLKGEPLPANPLSGG